MKVELRHRRREMGIAQCDSICLCHLLSPIILYIGRGMEREYGSCGARVTLIQGTLVSCLAVLKGGHHNPASSLHGSNLLPQLQGCIKVLNLFIIVPNYMETMGLKCQAAWIGHVQHGYLKKYSKTGFCASKKRIWWIHKFRLRGQTDLNKP